ncbi:MAG: hypothetical protein AAF399_15045 [Bacteroidota bacterium]
MHSIPVILLGMGLCLLSSLQAQSLDLAFFRVDTVGGQSQCALPMIYFESGNAMLIDTYYEDIGYLASLMHKYPDMSLQISYDGLYRRFNNQQRRLNRKRINYVSKVLHKEYGIAKKRLIKIPHRPWVFLPKKADPPPALVSQRLICECVWK